MANDDTNYVVASDIQEAWIRFRAKLYHKGEGAREYAQLRVDEMEADDHCDPPCKYAVYEFDITVKGPDVAGT